MENDNKNIVFLIGANRSGTSLLSSLLSNHPEITPLHQETGPKFGRNHTFGYSESYLWEKYDRGIDIDLWGLTKHLERMHLIDVDSKTFNILNKEFQNLINGIQGTILIKKPRNSLRVPMITKICSNVKFILIVRNGDNYVFGGRTKFKSPKSDIELKEHWFNVNKIAIFDLNKYAPNSHHIVFLEELVDKNKTNVVIDGITNFLGIQKHLVINKGDIKQNFHHTVTSEKQDLNIFYE